MTRVICLTGGIGSGKTTVANYFREEGVPVYISDDEAKKIMERPDIVLAVQNIFDVNVIQDDGLLNRKLIRELVFNRSDLLEKLNNIVHPEVVKDFETWLNKYKNYDFVIKESAILFESKMNLSCDSIILVTAPEEVRIKRVMERDGVSRINVEEIINKQMTDKKKAKYCQYIIENLDNKIIKSEVKNVIDDILTKNS